MEEAARHEGGGRSTEAALIRQNEVLLSLARSEAIDSGDLPRAFREITEASSNALGIERVGIWFYADATKDAMSSPDLFLRSTGEHATAPLLSHTAFPTYFAELAKERVIPAHDAHTHPATSELSAAYLTPLGIGALLDAPIRWHGRMVGLVCHEHVGPARTWTQDEINFAGMMADLVARALEADARRRAQDELTVANRTLEERIAQRTRELAETNARLRELNDLKNEMFQNVSHELRTPLTLVLAPVERMIASSSLAADDRARLGSVRNNALRLLGLINDVLDLAKLDSTHSIETVRAPVDVAAFARATFGDVESALADRGLRGSVDAPSSRSYALDERHLERIVFNLLSNAMKFTPEGGAITLTVKDAEDGLRLTVKDTGIGIPAAEQPLVFERFRQVDRGRARRFEGTGIGLSLVQQLTSLLGGTVSLTSEVGVGSTFEVFFPASLRVDAAPVAAGDGDTLYRRAARAAFTRDVVAPRTLGAHGPLVLVAEDDPGIRRELAEILAPRCRVVTCADGEEALACAVERTPDVILADVMMPKLDGVELVRQLRERPELRATAIMLVSAKADLEDRVRGREAGVDTYLTKPFHPEEVQASVDGLLRSRMRLVGPYVVHERLGRGSQSLVHQAEHRDTGAVVALKILSYASGDEADARDRIARERATLRRLQHPNIVKVLDEGEHAGGHYIAMELLRGVTVSELVRRNERLTRDEVIELGRGIADALATVHGLGLVHRDIKGSNLMIIEGAEPLRARVRLIDFGTVHTRTATGGDSLVGTLPYLAPELFQGGAASAASDIYALGVTLFQCATGRLPFQAPSRHEVVEAILREPVSATGLDSALDAVITRMLAKAPDQRIASGAAALEALTALPLEAMTPSHARRVDPDDETVRVRREA